MSAISPGALLAGYLALTGVVLFTGRDRIYAGGLLAHVGVLVAVGVATWAPGVPRWLRAWTPLLTLLFLYAEIPLLIRAIGHRDLYDVTVISWEARLFGGQPAAEWAGRWPSRLLSEVLHAAYLSYYPLIFAVPLVLWTRGRLRDFHEGVFTLILTFIACYVWYLFFPVAGPRYLWLAPAGAVDGPLRSITTSLLGARSSLGTAFPSSHVAVAVTQSLLAFRYFGVAGAPVAMLAVGLALGAVYGGFHYAIDVMAGAALGAVVTAVGLGAMRLAAARAVHANASAPT